MTSTDAAVQSMPDWAITRTPCALQICTACAEDCTCHSVYVRGLVHDVETQSDGDVEQQTRRFIPFVYTKPAEATMFRDHAGIVQHFKNVVDQIHPLRWAWCFDAAELQLKHVIDPRTGIKLALLLSRKYYESVSFIRIINANAVVRYAIWVVYPFLNASIRNKIRFD
jgi:hypothetical protein